MRFTAIEIVNFRQYQRLSLQFAKKTEHDLHIIIADNGVGKTNILNAITWCLYDEEPHLGNKSNSLPTLNLRAKNEALQEGKTNADVEVRLFANDAGESMVFCRKLSVRVENDFENRSELTVTSTKNGDAQILSGEKAESYVEKYMPKKIQQYFYFDGEQLDSYFISDESSKIKETIHAISQVDVVTLIKGRLAKCISSKQSEAGKKAPNIKMINEELNRKKEEIDKINCDLSELDKQIFISEGVIKTDTERLSGQENLPDLEVKFQKLSNKKNILDGQVQACKASLFAFIRDMKIVLSLYPNARRTLEIIIEKEKKNALPPNIDKKVLNEILINKNGVCLICGNSLSSQAKDHIKHLLDKIDVSSETATILVSIRNELERIIAAAESYPQNKQKLKKEYNDINNDIQQCECELQEVDNEINKFSDKQQVIQWHKERKSHQELLETNKNKKAVTEFQRNNAIQRCTELEIKLKKAIEKENECARLNQLIEFATKAKGIVENVESEMMTEVRTQMETRTRDYFNDLIWKKGVYDHITLDDQYHLELIHRDGYSCVGSCSAAERSLLALSFTLALHEVSGFNSLLFIDTPVARVSGQNRVNFANVLKIVSSKKQLIMAFTPDEYSESIKSVFAPIASTSVHLVMDENNEITSIE